MRWGKGLFEQPVLVSRRICSSLKTQGLGGSGSTHSRKREVCISTYVFFCSLSLTR